MLLPEFYSELSLMYALDLQVPFHLGKERNDFIKVCKALLNTALSSANKVLILIMKKKIKIVGSFLLNFQHIHCIGSG